MKKPSFVRVTWPGGHQDTYRITQAARRMLTVTIAGPPGAGTEADCELLDDAQQLQARGRLKVAEHVEGGAVLEILVLQRLDADGGAAAPTPAAAKPKPPPGPARSAKVTTRGRGRGATDGVAIGIDLGTSNTCVSYVVDGRPKVIPTRWGATTIPSVLAIVDGKVLVGPPAAKRLVLNPQETIYGSKRLVGRSYSDALADEYQPYFAFPLVETGDHQFGTKIREREITFEEVAERILAEAKAQAVAHIGKKIDRAVITVPAYFGEAQRAAVRRAGRAAGLNVARIVNEPTAAAVAYGYGRRESAKLLVFDLGGGTFDVSVLQLTNHRFEVIATDGDAFLGGIDVDDRIANHLLEELNRTLREPIEPGPEQIARLREVAEKCKMGLSVQKKFAVHLPHFAVVDGQPVHLQSNVTQEQVSALIDDFCARLMEITQRALAAKEIDPRSIDDVILVGGSTRLPQVQAAVEELFGRPPSKRINPDEAVALGAALLAESATVELIDVLPLSIGFAARGRRFMRLIARNTSVPTSRAFVIKTQTDNQTTYPMPLFQGERKDAANNEYLGTVLVHGIEPGPAGKQIEMTVALDPQCILDVSATDLASGRALDVELERTPSQAAVMATLGEYDGPTDEPDRLKPRTSALGWFFSRLRGLFGR